MNNVYEVLSGLNYNVLPVHDGNLLPAVLEKDGAPFAWLSEDLTIKSLDADEQELNNISAGIAYVNETMDLTTQTDYGALLTQYGQTAVTVDFDYDTYNTIYRIVAIDTDGIAVIDNFDTREQAELAFIDLSGIGKPLPDRNIQEQNRQRTFFDKLKKIGYTVKEALQDDRKYDIVDQNDQCVGHITRSNKFVLDTQKAGVRKSLSSLYHGNEIEHIKMPAWFEKLKEILNEIGMILAVKFLGQNKLYYISQNDKIVANISDTPTHDIVYAPGATTQQQQQIAAAKERTTQAIEQQTTVTKPLAEAAIEQPGAHPIGLQISESRKTLADAILAGAPLEEIIQATAALAEQEQTTPAEERKALADAILAGAPLEEIMQATTVLAAQERTVSADTKAIPQADIADAPTTEEKVKETFEGFATGFQSVAKNPQSKQKPLATRIADVQKDKAVQPTDKTQPVKEEKEL